MKNYTSTRKIAAFIAVAVGTGLVLTACGILVPGKAKVCPRVSLLKEAETITRYRKGTGRDLTDVLYEAKVLDIKSSCKYLNERVRMEAIIDIVAKIGPASKGSSAQVPFFVAIIDSKKNIIAKRTFVSEAEFINGRRRAGVREEIDQILYLKKGEIGSDYEVVIGLQLTKSQLQHNRGRRR